MDVDALAPGVDFIEAIDSAVNSCNVILALIGQRWLELARLTEDRLLKVDDDYVLLDLDRAITVSSQWSLFWSKGPVCRALDTARAYPVTKPAKGVCPFGQ